MLQFVINLVLTTVTLFVTAELIPDFEIVRTGATIFSCFIIGFINFLIRPFLGLTSFPLTLTSLGTVTFIINLLMLNVADGLIEGFGIKNWKVAIFGAILLTLLQLLINMATQRKHTLLR